MKNDSYRSRRSRTGFTLVELLTVIAIIGILAGMLMAVLPRVVNSGKKTKAKLEAQGIVTAIEAYDSATGRFPVSSAAQTAAGTNDFTYGGAYVIPPFAVGTTTIIGTAGYVTNNSEVIAILMDLQTFGNGVNTLNYNHVKNPQQTKFLSATMAGDTSSPGVGLDGVYRDPWGNPYLISLDLNYDEQCNDVFYSKQSVSQSQANSQTGFNGLFNPDAAVTGNSDNFQQHGKVMVWSAGADKMVDPSAPAKDGANKDNVLSWAQ